MSMMNEYAAFVLTRSERSPVSSDQERIWIAASQRGDTRAFNCLVQKWETRIYNVALRLLHDREEAAEAAQEVFLLAYRSIRRFRRDAAFSTWLYRIALNHCLTRLRQRPPGIHVSLADEAGTELLASPFRVAETQMEALLQAEVRQRVGTALAQLTPEQQAVVELRFFQELKFEEIAAILEIPLSTIKSRLYAALEMLRMRLGSEA